MKEFVKVPDLGQGPVEPQRLIQKTEVSADIWKIMLFLK